MPGKYLPDDPAVLEREVAPKTYLGTQDPEALDIELGFPQPKKPKPLKSRDELEALPFLERQEARLQQVALRWGTNAAEAFVNMGITALDSGMALKDYFVNMMLTPERLQEIHAEHDKLSRESGLGGLKPLPEGAKFKKVKHDPLPKVHFVRPFEEVGALVEPSVLEDVAGRAGHLHGWLAGFTASVAATGATGVAAYAMNTVGLGALTYAEMLREERLTGHSYTDEQKLGHSLFAAAAGLGGPLVGKGITKTVEKLLNKPLGRMTQEAISTTSLGALFEGGGALYEGIPLSDPEAWKRIAAGVIGFNTAHLQATLFAGPARPRTKAAQEKSFELTAELAEKVDLGLKPRKGRHRDGTVEQDYFDRLNAEIAKDWYQNLTSPVVSDVRVNVNPRTLVELFGIPIETANRIVQERFSAEEIRWNKFEQAREEMAFELGGLDAAKEVRLRRTFDDPSIYDADPLFYDRYLRESRQKFTEAELEAMYPTDQAVAERLTSDPAFRDRIDGWGDRNETLRRKNEEAHENAQNREFQDAGPAFTAEQTDARLRDARGFIEFTPNEPALTSMDLFPKHPSGADRTGGLTVGEIQARRRHGKGELVEEVPGEEVIVPIKSLPGSGRERRLPERTGEARTPPATAEQAAAAEARSQNLEPIGPGAGKGPGAIRGTPEKPSTTVKLRRTGETVRRTQRGEAGEPKGRPADRARAAAKRRADAKEAARVTRAEKLSEGDSGVKGALKLRKDGGVDLVLVGRDGKPQGEKVVREGAMLPVQPQGETLAARPKFLSPSTYKSRSSAKGMLTKAKKKHPKKSLAIVEVEPGKFRIAELEPFKAGQKTDTAKHREPLQPVEVQTQPTPGGLSNPKPEGFSAPIYGRSFQTGVEQKGKYVRRETHSTARLIEALDAARAANPGKEIGLEALNASEFRIVENAKGRKVIYPGAERSLRNAAAAELRDVGPPPAEAKVPKHLAKILRDQGLGNLTPKELAELREGVALAEKVKAEKAKLDVTESRETVVGELGRRQALREDSDRLKPKDAAPKPKQEGLGIDVPKTKDRNQTDMFSRKAEAEARRESEQRLREDPEFQKDLEQYYQKKRTEAQQRRAAEERKKAKKAKEPLNKFEDELYLYIEKNPKKTPEEVREGLGDVKSSETTTKKWVGVSKAFLGERNAMLRAYNEFRSARGKPAQLEGESAANYRDRVRAKGSFDGQKVEARQENFLRWLREQPEEYFGSVERRERFIEEELAGGFSASDKPLPPDTPAAEAWNARPRNRVRTPEEEAFLERTMKMTPEERQALSEAEVELFRSLQDSTKPDLGPGDMKLPLFLLGTIGGAAALAQMDEEKRANAVFAGVPFLMGMKRRLKAMDPRQRSRVTVVDSPIERWTKKEHAARPEVVEPMVPKEAPKHNKPTERTIAKVEDKIAEKLREGIRRELESSGGAPLEDAPALERRRLSWWQDRFVNNSGQMTELFEPIMFSMEHHFGKHGRVMWMLTNKGLMTAQREKREVQFKAQEAGEWDVALSKALTPKNIAKGQSRSDYDNQNDILVQLHEKVQRPIELQEQIRLQEHFIRTGGRASDIRVHEETLKIYQKEQADALKIEVDKPNSDKIAAQVLGRNSRMWQMPVEVIADAWGIKPSEKVLKMAKQRRALEEELFSWVLQNAVQEKLMLPYMRGPYGPANQADFVKGPKTSSEGLKGRALKNWELNETRAKKATDLMAKNLVYRTRLSRQPIQYHEAKTMIEQARTIVDEPFKIEGLEEMGKKMGNIDQHKLIDIIIGVEADFGRLMKSYIEPAIDRINHARVFGRRGEVAQNLIRKSYMDGYDADPGLIRLHDGAWATRKKKEIGRPSKALREAAGVVTISTMGLSGPAQLTSYLRPLLEADTRSFARSLIPAARAQIYQSRAMRKVFPEWFIRTFGSREWAEFVSHMGTMAQSEAVSAMVDLGGYAPTAAAFMLKNVYGTSSIDRMGRNIGAISGNFTTKKLLDRYQKLIQNGEHKKAEKEVLPYLREIFGEFAGRDGGPGDPLLWQLVVEGNYSPAELLQLSFIGGQIIGDRSSGRTFPADMPLHAQHPLFAPLFKLSQFAYRQTHETYRELNPKNPSSPLRNPRTADRFMRGLAVSTAGAALVLHIRSLMKGDGGLTWEEVWSVPFIRKAISYHGTAPLFLDFFGIVRGDFGPYEEQAGGPVYSKILETTASTAKTLDKKDPTYLGRTLVDLMPYSWWNTLGVPDRKDLKEKWFPYKSRRGRRKGAELDEGGDSGSIDEGGADEGP